MKLVGVLFVTALLLVFFSLPLWWTGLFDSRPPHGFTIMAPLALDVVAALLALLGVRLRNEHLRDRLEERTDAP
jgi:hypothetical protein